jgi:DNA replication protein DnaC
MECSSTIKSHLKELRLRGMHENLDMRNTEAITHKVSYLDFLLHLTQDECDRRKFRKKELSIKKANLGKARHILEFDFDFNPSINRQQIVNLSTCEFIHQNENIIFVGPTGVGKTCLAKALALEACSKGYKVLFTRTAKMLELIYSGKADGSYQKKLDSFIKPELLILDDWGMTPFPDMMLNILNEVISERYENGSIIITSNRPFTKWDELFTEPVISSALLDRLFHNAHKIKIQGKSYRQGSKSD